MYKILLAAILVFYSALVNGQIRHPLKMANIFGDNMVIQQGMQAPVWGMAVAGEPVTVDFAGTHTVSRADKNGRWQLRMPVLRAGGPFVMEVRSGGTSLTLRNVMIGEVWLASGQSNMEFPLSRVDHAKDEIGAANYPDIRLFTVRDTTGIVPQADIPAAAWRPCDPAAAGFFSGVGYYFARSLYADRKVAIGVIHSSWGGSSAEAWTGSEVLAGLPEFKDKLLALDKDTARWNARVAKSTGLERERALIAKTAQQGLRAGVQMPGYDDSKWKRTDYPLTMERLGLPEFWGFVWFRKEVEIPASAAGKELLLSMPVYSDEHTIYFNGVETGHFEKATSTFDTIPGSLVRAGHAVIAIRMRTYFGTGRIGNAGATDPALVSADGQVHIPVSGEWKSHGSIEPGMAGWQDYFNTLSVLYNGMIAPLMPFGIKGVIWYQGENNVSNPLPYYTLFPAMITGWRQQWGEGDFPFLFVQIASMQKQGETDKKLALLREAQSGALRLPHTGMATAVDLGVKDDTHPKNKKDVGERLALAARKVAYGENVVGSGPVFESLRVDGGSLRVLFSSVGSGLVAKGDGGLRGFRIAGDDRKFYPAEARIEGGEVVVHSDAVPVPLAVRYCFESWPDGNLYNGEGLAAPPFRTDGWNVLNQGRILSFRSLASAVREYEKAEWEIRVAAGFVNPYLAEQVALDMVLHSPSGKEIVLPCYYESGDTAVSVWKARLAPRETGSYTYSFRLTQAGKVATSATASFQAVASGKDGFLHTEAGNLWTYRFDDGKPFRGLGENVAWEGRAFEDPKNTFEYFLPKIARNGGNFFRTISCAWNLPMEQQVVETKRRFSKHYSNTTQYYHPQGLARTDRLVELADSLGLYFLLTLYWHGELKPSEHWGIFPYNSAIGGTAATPQDFFTDPGARQRFKNRVRYIIARWGYSTHIAMLDLFNEIDNATYAVIKDAGGSSSDSVIIPHKYVTAWHAEMSHYIHSIDPYGHIVASSISHRKIDGLFDKGGLDVIQEHIYKRTDYLPRAIDSMTDFFKKPFVIGEYGFRWEDANPRWTVSYDYDFKKGLWYGLFSPTPVVPMTWWWEFFDRRNMMAYLSGVRQISDRMLLAGGGKFRKVAVAGEGMITQGLQCGDVFFANILNNDSTDSRIAVSVIVGGTGPYTATLFNPDTRQYSSLPSTLHEGVLTVEKRLYRRQTNTILIISAAAAAARYDVVVYGGTSSGIMAAITAARKGHTVALLEQGDHIGGMMTSGLGWTDYGKPDLGRVIGGLPREFFNRVRDHYGREAVRKFNAAVNSRLGDDGWYFEPHVAEGIFREMLREAGVTVYLNSRLREKKGVIREGNRIVALDIENGLRLTAGIFIDAGYEGDVMAQAGVRYTVGREPASQYHEPLAGVMPLARHTDIEAGMEQGIGSPISAYDAKGLLPGVYAGPRGVPGAGDKKVQAYTFRLCLTKDTGNRLPIDRPADYDPRRYEVLLRLLSARKEPITLDAILKTSPLPGGKTDVNNQGAFSTDYVNGSWDYAEASYTERDRIYQDHAGYEKGLLYFLLTDARLPAAVRTGMRQWGYARDEFADHGGWPYQLYVREGRRMVGDYVMVQEDVQRSLVKDDAIGMGSYAADSHIIQRRVNGDSLVENEGQMYENIVTRPYQIPYRALTPKHSEAVNLLVSICLSASHVAYQTLRMEPQFMITGEAAGMAAHLALQGRKDVQQVDIAGLRSALQEEHAVLQFDMK